LVKQVEASKGKPRHGVTGATKRRQLKILYLTEQLSQESQRLNQLLRKKLLPELTIKRMKKISLLDVNTSVLKEYRILEELNPGSWNIGEYLNLKFDLNAAIAFSKLYFPDFIEKEGCILLGFTYNEETFRQWYELFNGDIPAIESKCNLYEVADYFSLNRSENESLDSYNQAIDEFGKLLKTSWEINCKILFPDRNIVVEVFDEFDTTRITLYSSY